MPRSTVSDRQRNRAKSLRQKMTRAETLLWRHLKANRLEGVGFRQQAPINNYVADFISHSTRLIVELDGESHDFVARQSADKARDRWFESQATSS
jgi:very-short-patch-repair endonuclease